MYLRIFSFRPATSRPARQAAGGGRGRGGFALVLTLCVLVLLTVLVVGFTITARFDRILSSGYAKAGRAELMAFSAVNHAEALLASNIPDVGLNAPATPANWWVAPGRLWTQSANNSPLAINLYSGDYDASDPNGAGPDLNRAKIDGTYPIEPGGTPMRVAWIAIGKDPSKPVAADNPMVGRFAYWIDAENTRLNLRTAKLGTGARSELAPSATTYVPAVRGSYFALTGGTPAADGSGGTAPGSPFLLDLSGLTGANKITFPSNVATANSPQISNVREFREYFASDADWSGPNGFYSKNQFELSVWGESPEFTPFGQRRLTSNQNRTKTLPGFTYYWDLNDPGQMLAEPMTLSAGNYPPGTGPAVNEYAYYKHSARMLAEGFQSTQWPGYSGSSLADKWSARAGLPSGASAKLAEQVAWNMLTSNGFMVRGGGMIEMSGLGAFGRSGALTAGDITSGDVTTGKPLGDLLPSVLNSSTGGRYQGQSGNPYVTELGLELLWDTSAGKNLRIKMVGELYTGNYVNAFDCTGGVDTDRGIGVGPSGVNADGSLKTDGVYLVPIAASFEIPAAATTITAGTTVSGWTTSALGTKLVFTLAPANPFSGWITTPGRLSAELVDGSKNAIALGTRLKAGNFLVFRSPQSITPARDTSLVIPLAGSATSVALTNVQLKVVAVRDPGSGNYFMVQYCPLYDTSAATGSLLFATPQKSTITLPDMSVNSATTGSQAFTVEVDDPRQCALSDAWTACANTGSTYAGKNTLGLANANWPASLPEIRAFCLSLSGTIPSVTGYYPSNPGDQGAIYSPGQYSTLWTAPPYIVNSTIDLSLNLTSSDTGIPDHLALELVNAFTGLSLGSNYGTVNPNGRIYPTSWGLPTRTKALQALFKRWKVNNTAVNYIQLATDIAANMPADGYKYKGELIPYLEKGGSPTAYPTKWQKQALYRSLAGRLSTQSNTFGVWGVAQSIKQTSTGALLVDGEKRFYAVIRRRPFPGIDGVYGNAKTDASGNFVETIPYASTTTPQYELMRDNFDGPDGVPVPTPASVPTPDKTSTTAPLRNAFHPLKPYMTYETAYFEYLEP